MTAPRTTTTSTRTAARHDCSEDDDNEHEHEDACAAPLQNPCRRRCPLAAPPPSSSLRLLVAAARFAGTARAAWAMTPRFGGADGDLYRRAVRLCRVGGSESRRGKGERRRERGKWEREYVGVVGLGILCSTLHCERAGYAHCQR
ncbi:Os09g0111500 [Oryza sativa Japonica Group]|uniref:Os09g0111500 protein n=1 Tax=Oryza sativa subsp. japonica TaxID=39947 RepID=A0A0P0XK71_ORYSJ|nr:Os09g0111500 [Oryza sativa Japonica Group]